METEFTGKTVDEAIQNGLKELNLKKEDAFIEIVSQGGVFEKSKVKITAKPQNNTQTAQKTQKNDVKIAKNTKNSDEQQVVPNKSFGSQLSLDGGKKSQKAQNLTQNSNLSIPTPELFEKNIKISTEFLENLFKQMNIKAKVEVKNLERAIILDVQAETTEENKILIGHHGETMQAIQTLLNNLLEKGSKLSKKILIDIGNYREAQEQKLKDKTISAIERCLQTAKPVTMDFMNAYERHLVHEIVLEDGRVVSESFGKEPRRFVKIFIK